MPYAKRRFMMSILMISVFLVSAGLNPVIAANNYNDQYSMEVQALKGPDDTEVIVTLATSDPGAYPIPSSLKKIQIKIRNEEDEVVYIVNERNPEIVGDQVIRFVAEPAPHEILEIKALIQAGKRVVVLQSKAPVQMRPDLVVQAVSAPETVDVEEPFNIDVNIQELNGELGASATVSLYVDGSLSAAYPSVQVDRGGLTTVVFAGLTFSDVGIKDLSVVISDAAPAEFDITNNDTSFTIEVAQAIQATNYSLSYQNYNNYYNHSYDNYCGRNYNWLETGAFDYFYLDGQSYGDVITGTINEASWTVGSENGTARSGSISNWNPTDSGTWGANYYHQDPATGTWLYVYSRPYSGYTSFHLRVYSGSRVYVYNYYGNSYSGGTNYGAHMNAQSTVSASLLIDGNVSIGGSATANVNAPYHYNYSNWNWYYSYYCGWYYSGYNYSYDYYTAYASGVLDPIVLAKGIAGANEDVEISLPERVSLDGNYPNPFNPSTTINYALPEAGNVSVLVYDLKGQLVETLVSGHQSAGYHEVQLNAPNLVSGTYLYVLETGSFREVKKMMLLK